MTTSIWNTARLAVGFLLLACASAWAQDTGQDPPELSNLTLAELVELEIDSVYGASGFSQKVTEAPSSITIVSADEIQQYGHRTLADVLRSVRGFYVTYDRNYSYLGVRGFSRPGDYNARVLLLVDGHRLNDNIFGAALIGTEFPMDVDLIDRVEIIRGPSSSVYGTSAFFAVINVITRRGGAVNGIEATGSRATLGTHKGRVSFGRQFANGADLLISATSYGSRGERRLFFEEFNTPATNNGIAENVDGDQFDNYFGKLTLGRVTVQGLYGARDKSIPTASFGTVFNDQRSRTIERQGFVDVLYERAVTPRWDVGARAHFDHYSYDGDYVFDDSINGEPFPIVNRDFARGNWLGTEFKVTTKRRRHTIAFGSEYRNNFRQDQLNYDEAPYLVHLDDRRSSTNWAFYGQDEIALHRTLLLNIGLRHDHYDTFGGTTNPRAGLIYSPFSKTTVKLLYGEAFRAPNAYELFWRQDGVAKSNAELGPESNRTTEIVLEQYLGSHLRVSATGFHYGIKGLITQQTDPLDNLLVYNNVDAIRAKGLELEVEGKWANGLRARVGHTFEDSRNDETGLALTNSPKHLSKLNAIAPLGVEGVSAGVELQYISARRTVLGDQVPGVLVPNLTITSQMRPQQLQLSASVHNLFNRKYADPGSEEHRQDRIGQSGRTVWVELTFRLPH